MIEVIPMKPEHILPLIIARQIRIIFVNSHLVSTCAIIQVFGCQSQSNHLQNQKIDFDLKSFSFSDGLISTRFPQRSILNT